VLAKSLHFHGSSILSTRLLTLLLLSAATHIMSWPPVVCWRVYEELFFSLMFQVGRLGDDGGGAIFRIPSLFLY
jgi:hypothetical protein